MIPLIQQTLRGAIVALFLAASIGVGATEPVGDALASDSVYQLDIALTDQNDRARTFASQRGRVSLVSMFYATCRFTCPLIIDALRQTEQALDAEARARLAVLLVSFDPEQDTPEELLALAVQRKLDLQRWTLARTESANVRTLAAILDIRYRELPDGEFSHTSPLILLDAQGRILARTDVLGKADPAFVEAVRQALTIR